MRVSFEPRPCRSLARHFLLFAHGHLIPTSNSNGQLTCLSWHPICCTSPQIALARRALKLRRLLHLKLTRFSTGTQRRLKSRHPFVPAREDLLKTGNDFIINPPQWLDHAWNKEWKDNITKLYTFCILQTYTTEKPSYKDQLSQS